MKRIIILLSALALLATSCTITPASASNPPAVSNGTFVTVENNPFYSYRIVYDKNTKVMYVESDTGDGGCAFTLLVNANGTPRVYGK